MSIRLEDGNLIISSDIIGSLGLDYSQYLIFNNNLTPEKEKKIKNRIIEIISEENGLELLKKAVYDQNPESLRKMYKFSWVFTDKDLRWWGERERKINEKRKLETNLKIFEFRIEELRKSELDEKSWKRYWLNQEYQPCISKIRLKRLQQESKRRMKRSLSMSDIKEDENDLFQSYVKGEWKYIDHPPLSQLGMPWKRIMDKKKRGPLA